MNIQRKISSSRFSVVGEEAGIDVLEAPRSLDREAAVERWRGEAAPAEQLPAQRAPTEPKPAEEAAPAAEAASAGQSREAEA